MKTYRRINKSIARKLFNQGKDFWIVPCKLRPEFGLLISCTVGGRYRCDFETFETFLNAFEYYNCNNETGRYCAYYIEE